MLQRMLKEQLISAEYESPLRTIFMTASPILCDAIRRTYENLLNSFSSLSSPQDDHPREIYDAGELSNMKLSEIPAHCFPLIITYDTLLKMLENSFTAGDTSMEVERYVTFELFEDVYYKQFSELGVYMFRIWVGGGKERALFLNILND